MARACKVLGPATREQMDPPCVAVAISLFFEARELPNVIWKICKVVKLKLQADWLVQRHVCLLLLVLLQVKVCDLNFNVSLRGEGEKRMACLPAHLYL